MMDVQCIQLHKLARVVKSGRAQRRRRLTGSEVAAIDFKSVFLETRKTDKREHADQNVFFIKYHPPVNSKVST